MQKLLFDVLNAVVTAAVAALLWWYFAEKRSGHDGQDRDR